MLKYVYMNTIKLNTIEYYQSLNFYELPQEDNFSN